jgi:hypothetical protein
MRIRPLADPSIQKIFFLSACFPWHSIAIVLMQIRVQFHFVPEEFGNSSGRREENQRLKKCSMFWLAEGTKSKLQIRAIVVSKRWDEIISGS